MSKRSTLASIVAITGILTTPTYALDITVGQAFPPQGCEVARWGDGFSSGDPNSESVSIFALHCGAATYATAVSKGKIVSLSPALSLQKGEVLTSCFQGMERPDGADLVGAVNPVGKQKPRKVWIWYSRANNWTGEHPDIKKIRHCAFSKDLASTKGTNLPEKTHPLMGKEISLEGVEFKLNNWSQSGDMVVIQQQPVKRIGLRLMDTNTFDRTANRWTEVIAIIESSSPPNKYKLIAIREAKTPDFKNKVDRIVDGANCKRNGRTAESGLVIDVRDDGRGTAVRGWRFNNLNSSIDELTKSELSELRCNNPYWGV
jgi:hypothetical protein